tara:strand:- start:583 stop:753 length:171 start_codon:yes stop_codon:yes gene_type:complete
MEGEKARNLTAVGLTVGFEAKEKRRERRRRQAPATLRSEIGSDKQSYLGHSAVQQY